MHFELGKEFLILDGAMGTVLQQRGLPPGGAPELLNLTDPELLMSVYRDYIAAGSQVIYANTFGANGLKLKRIDRDVGWRKKLLSERKRWWRWISVP